MPAIAGLDHVILAVRDLEAARDAWIRLGFTVTPRGRHIGWGTANYCIMFGADYIELLGIADPSGFDNGLAARLAAEGEGLLGIALATADADAAATAFAAAGIAGAPPRDLARLLELPEGTVRPEFRLAHPGGSMPLGMPAFACEHRTPELLRRPEWLRHANGATGIAGLTLPRALAPAEAEAWRRLDGAAVGPDGVVQVGGFTLCFAAESGPVRLDIGVASLAAAQAALAAGGIAAEVSETAVTVPPGGATGVALVFVSAPGSTPSR